ncbi:MAG: CoA transferase [Gammaproteobacteria bacterium]
MTARTNPETMPLAGIRVLDFSRYIAGPYCAALLGYLGADVIRIEKPGGSEDRFVGPVSASASAVYLETGCNKRGMTLDIKHAEARAIVRRLVAGADVVIANMPPGALVRAGLDYETLCAIKPDIVLTTQTGFGHVGPWRDRGGFDGIGQVMSGSAFLSGTPDAPARSATPFADFGTAALGAFATLGALYQRRDTGRGQHVQASLLGTALTFFNPALIEQAVLGVNRVPSGNRGQTSAPTDIFRTRDGHVLTHVVGNGLFRRLAGVIGEADWLTNPDYASDQSRGEQRDAICARVAQWCAERSTDDVLDTLAAAGVPAGPVLDLDAALAHPQAAAMNLLTALGYPDIDGAAPVARFPLDMSAHTPPQQRAPTIGEHTEEILRELGFDAPAITALREAGAV